MFLKIYLVRDKESERGAHFGTPLVKKNIPQKSRGRFTDFKNDLVTEKHKAENHQQAFFPEDILTCHSYSQR